MKIDNTLLCNQLTQVACVNLGLIARLVQHTLYHVILGNSAVVLLCQLLLALVEMDTFVMEVFPSLIHQRTFAHQDIIALRVQRLLHHVRQEPILVQLVRLITYCCYSLCIIARQNILP